MSITSAQAGLIGAGVSVVGGVADHFITQKRIRDQEALQRQAEGDYDAQMDKLSKLRYTQTQASRDADMTRRGVDLSPLSSIRAEQMGIGEIDTRALMGGITGIDERSKQAVLDAKNMNFNQELEGRRYQADAANRIQEGNLGLARGENEMNLNLYQQSMMNAGNNIAALQGQQGSIPAKTAGNLLSMAPMFMEAKEGGKIDVISRILNNGGRPPVQKLEGPEDHDKKKFAIMEDGDVIDEDNNEKVAEATGGEYILNSEQAGSIHEEYESLAKKIDNGEAITDEEWMNFYKSVEGVFSEPQFNEMA